jgi:SAM-dependent methyltransferase
LLPEVAGRRVLDAGCSGGPHAAWLVEHGATVVGVDLSPPMIELARQRVPDAEFHVADLDEPLAFAADEEFDLVVSSLTLHYLPDWTDVLAEFQRVLKPGGSLVFSTHHPFMDAQLPSVEHYFQTDSVVQDTWIVGDAVLEVQFHRKTLSQILNAVIDAGFVVERVDEPVPTPELRDRYPEVAAIIATEPRFLFLRARRTGAIPS